MGGEHLELTPQERRTLRRFFHRHALPYVAGASAVAAIACVLALRAPDAPDGAATPAVDVAAADRALLRIEETLAAVEKARREAKAEVQEASRLLSRRSMAATQPAAIQALEQRIEAAAQRLAETEDLVAEAAGRPQVDTSALVTRLYNLERRIGELERTRPTPSVREVGQPELVEPLPEEDAGFSVPAAPADDY